MSNKCVCCNADIPEGIMVCQECVFKEYGVIIPYDSETLSIDTDMNSSESSLKEKIFKKLNESVPLMDIARQLDITILTLTDIIFNAIWEEE